MDQAAELISAIAELVGAILWPAVVFLLLWAYKPEVIGLLRRLRKFTLPGGAGAEFDKDLDELEESASAASEATPPLPVPSPVITTAGSSWSQHLDQLDPSLFEMNWRRFLANDPQLFRPSAGGLEQTILAEAATSPKAALISLGAAIERKTREILATSHDRSAWDRPGLGSLKQLELPPTIQKAVSEFRRVRDRIVHGGGASEDEILRAIDSGIKILRAVESIPHVVRVVHAPRVELFEDSEGAIPREGVHGVMLETTEPEGEKSYAVFPTTRDDFEAGKPVAWEWSFEQVWPESWYRHPDSGEIEYAWTESAEFVGRHFEDI